MVSRGNRTIGGGGNRCSGRWRFRKKKKENVGREGMTRGQEEEVDRG